MKTKAEVTIIGGGLAGCEAAWQLAERGISVNLLEMKPNFFSPAHISPLLAELVCSNSLRSEGEHSPAGLLKAELAKSHSFILDCAHQTRVPAGEALAVDRRRFSQLCTTRLMLHPKVTIIRGLSDRIPAGITIVAGGPLVAGGVARKIQQLCGERLYFYDAIAPIVDAQSIDRTQCFMGSRYGIGTQDEGDYINCPLSKAEYYAFIEEILKGRKITPRPFEEARYFEGCLPIEVMAERGKDTLAFGPLKPVGLIDKDGNQPFAVVQLRAENIYKTAYNLVGFQTRLAYPEQKRIFAMIPALQNAQWLRFGSIHRNSYVEGPRVLDEKFAIRGMKNLYLAGQITGVEGYIESTAIGLVVALFVFGQLRDKNISPPPITTALGALYQHVVRPQPGKYLPTNINFGLFPPVKGHDRRRLYVQRAQADIQPWLRKIELAKSG